MSEISCPLKKSWKLRWRMARRAAGKRRASGDALDSDDFCAGMSEEATVYDATHLGAMQLMHEEHNPSYEHLLATPLVTFW